MQKNTVYTHVKQTKYQKTKAKTMPVRSSLFVFNRYGHVGVHFFLLLISRVDPFEMQINIQFNVFWQTFILAHVFFRFLIAALEVYMTIALAGLSSL